MQQSTLLGDIDVVPAGAAVFASAYSWLRRFIGDDERDRPGDLTDAAHMARAVAFAVTAIQRKAFIALSRGLTVGPASRSASERRFPFAMAFEHREATMATVAWLNEVGRAFAGHGRPNSSALSRLEDLHAALVATLRRFRDPGQNRFFVLQTAYENGIPTVRLPGARQLLGQGSRARLLDSAMTEHTSAIGYQWSVDKRLTAAMLHRAGLPGAIHRSVTSEAEAATAALELGYPVVVKPADRRGGAGVFADIRDEATLRHAFAESRQLSRNILVERHFEGDGHRLTVMEGQVIRVTRKRPWGITGDGISSIATLAERSPRPESGGTALDDEALGLLRQQGLNPFSILEESRFVALRRRNNAAAGGDSTTLDTNTVHPDNLALARRAAATLRLNIAGVDLLIADIGRSWLESGALICEVNAQPQMSGKLVEQMVKSQATGAARVPVFLLILPTDHDATTPAPARPLARALGNAPIAVAAGVWIGESRQCAAPDAFAAARMLLEMPDVDRALCVMTAKDILTHGLPTDRFERIYFSGAPIPPRLWSMLQPHAGEGRLRIFRPASGA